MIQSMASTEETSAGMPLFQFRSGARGRPQIIISQGVMEYLIGNCFTIHQIALLLQTSPSTVRRHMNRYNISVRSTYPTISDTDLDHIVSGLCNEHPNSGYRMLRGHLTAMGLRVQEDRVRESIRRVDPVVVVNRWIRNIHRRTYSVPSPNALWHMDGNHKLIRYNNPYINIASTEAMVYLYHNIISFSRWHGIAPGIIPGHPSIL